MKNLKLVLALATLGVATAVGLQTCEAHTPAQSPEACAYRWVLLTSPDGKEVIRIKAEQALTQPQREKGLMFRDTMPFDQGMIFYWETPQPIYMWMKNTLIPLDMVFALKGEVTGVVEAAKTQSEDILTIPGNTDTVLEVNLGVASAKGVAKGWRLKPMGCAAVEKAEPGDN